LLEKFLRQINGRRDHRRLLLAWHTCSLAASWYASHTKFLTPSEWSNAWIKSPRMSAGQSPTANYNHALMRAILNDRMPYLSPMMNTKFIKLEDAPAAYKEFDAGSAYKYVIDPHGSVRQ
ncbi:hypothetical protein B7L10_038465, partial [Burkholderia cenocepacia]|nr:hypothetical protein [Burkholderia cenocepacia]MCW5163621.1 hypothetical protein [Burkholderia cenocepacia]MCW5171217.1 hypothetical protein [Burkholderia cenocepacia]